MTIRQAQTKYCATLQKRGVFTAFLDVDVLLSAALHKSQEFVMAHPEANLSAGQTRKMDSWIRLRAKHMPLAYLLGTKEFFGYEFKVTPDVLVPRPETEHLVEKALDIVGKEPNKKWRIIDVGTGSGTVIVAFARKAKEQGWPLSKYQLIATELSAKALNIARQNARKNGVSKFIKFQKADLLKNVRGKFDILIANLPYVPLKEYFGSPCYDIIKWEPKMAITDGKDGLSTFRIFLEQAAQHLSEEGGHILFEMGYNQGKKICAMVRGTFPTALSEIKKDLAGFQRNVFTKIPGK